MANTLSISVAQCNPLVGDIAGNLKLVKSLCLQAQAKLSELLVFPECVLTGYPAEDLWLCPAFIQETMQAVNEFVSWTKDKQLAVYLTSPWKENGKLYNAGFLIERGKIIHKQYKVELPNSGLFDDKRYFSHGALPDTVVCKGVRIGFAICEDMWEEQVIAHLSLQNPDLLITSNASPYAVGKQKHRVEIAKARAMMAKAPLIYVNQVGGQDDLVFDGQSFVVSANGELVTEFDAFTEGLFEVLFKYGKVTAQPSARRLTEDAEIYQALMLGTRDYVLKNGFSTVLLGLSGGVDSALVATIAADALGADNVQCFMLPSPYTSALSHKDAEFTAKALGITIQTIAIDKMMKATNETLQASLGDLQGITAENIQSRLRALILMAHSNKSGAMLLTTGNKSELATGYATLYGDMCGGFNPLKDVYKTQIYQLCSWRNRNKPIGTRTPFAHSPFSNELLNKPASAELRPDQTDQDSLPPYEILDSILFGLVEDEASYEELIESGHIDENVYMVARLLRNAEYKRSQSPPGPKVSRRAFTRERRYPLTNGFTA